MSFRIDEQELKESLKSLIKNQVADGQLLNKYLESEICKFFVHIKEYDLGVLDRFDLTLKEIGEPTMELMERSPPQTNLSSNSLNVMATFSANLTFTGTNIIGVFDGQVNYPLPGLANLSQTTILIKGIDFEGVFKIAIINGSFMIWLESDGLKLTPVFKIEFEESKHLDTSPLENYLLGLMKKRLIHNRLLLNIPFDDLFGKIKSF
jgi:hypothetical protein